MIQAKCIQKFRDKNNKIYGYRLIDLNGNTQDVNPESLKQAIKNKQIHIVNLTLTSDNRLIDSNEVHLQNKEILKEIKKPNYIVKQETAEEKMQRALEYIFKKLSVKIGVSSDYDYSELGGPDAILAEVSSDISADYGTIPYQYFVDMMEEEINAEVFDYNDNIRDFVESYYGANIACRVYDYTKFTLGISYRLDILDMPEYTVSFGYSNIDKAIDEFVIKYNKFIKDNKEAVAKYVKIVDKLLQIPYELRLKNKVNTIKLYEGYPKIVWEFEAKHNIYNVVFTHLECVMTRKNNKEKRKTITPDYTDIDNIFASIDIEEEWIDREYIKFKSSIKSEMSNFIDNYLAKYDR